ncbi:hypothetical protein [Nocardia alni]|uniref:hypothetical protein n=1 Tax=Nocardia alni TaxID=2815723 RepID=UPI0020B3E8A6|nr:hypothetical protein [Nocardia alni]
MAVLLERAEERGVIPPGHTLKDRQVQLQHALTGVEHAAEVAAQASGDILHLDLGHEIEVQFRPQLPDRGRQDPRALLGGLVVGQLARHLVVDELREGRQIANGPVREPPPDHHRLQVDVESCGDEGLVPAGHHDQLVHELVVRTPPLADLVAQRPFLVLAHMLDDQHLEIRTVALGGLLLLELPRIGREHVQVVGAGVLHIARAVRLRGERTVDPHDRLRELVIAAGGEKPLHTGELRRSRIGPVGLERTEFGQQLPADVRPFVFQLSDTAGARQPVGGLLQPAP